MAPEWLVEIPDDLASNWYVMSRPEGQRCLVIASHGTTMVRSRTGHFKNSFLSGLPCGGGAGDGGAMQECILDCIFHPGNNTFYVLGRFFVGGSIVCLDWDFLYLI
jgi:snurportin-1